jgi:hypothetical protein
VAPGLTTSRRLAAIGAVRTSDAPPLKLMVPPLAAAWVLNQEADLTISANDSGFARWQRLALYNGARQLAEITSTPAGFPLTDLHPGIHAFPVV